MKQIDKALISKMIDQVNQLDESMLYSGLTVVVKDTAEFLAARGIYDDQSFDFLANFGDVMSNERKYWEDYGSELFEPLAVSGLPHGFVKAAADGFAELEVLKDTSIRHEWTSHPGRKFLEKFAQKFKDTICKGENSIYNLMEKDLLNQADLPKSIVASILSAGISVATFWYPLAIYISLLIVKAGLKTYCEPG